MGESPNVWFTLTEPDPEKYFYSSSALKKIFFAETSAVGTKSGRPDTAPVN
jgi:hypothetical protein